MRLREHPNDTILLICGSESESVGILTKLFDAGFGVVGPAPNATLALALAAQTTPTIAVVITQPTGKRCTVELADELKRTWGIPSWVRETVGCDRAVNDPFDWRAPTDQVARIRQRLALGEERALVA